MCMTKISTSGYRRAWMMKSLEPYQKYKEDVAPPVTTFNLPLLFHHNGHWNPENGMRLCRFEHMQTAFLSQFCEPRGLSADEEIWELGEMLGTTRAQADIAAETLFSGFTFFWKNNSLANAPIASNPKPAQRICVDPALCLGIMARIQAGFYNSNRSPDYTVGHLLQTNLSTSDARLSGPDLYPIWHL